MQRAEAVALVAVLPADDDEFLPLDAFDLEPAPCPLALIWRAGLLGDDPLAALLADRVEQRLALADDMVAVEDWRTDRLEQRGEPFLTLGIGQFGDVLALIDQQIEGVESKVSVAAL